MTNGLRIERTKMKFEVRAQVPNMEPIPSPQRWLWKTAEVDTLEEAISFLLEQSNVSGFVIVRGTEFIAYKVANKETEDEENENV